MFEKSRRKIVAAIMSILVLLWAGTLGVIYISSYLDMARQNEQMLRGYVQMYTLSKSVNDMPIEPPSPKSGGDRFEPGFFDSPSFQLAIFYSVALSYDGTVMEVNNQIPTVYSDAELTESALEIFMGKKESGTKGNLVYLKADKGGYLLISFMDNTRMNENTNTLLRYTMLFGGMVLVLFFFLSVFLAKRIVEPLEKSYEKQKQFISDAGHELKTPISIVSANAEILSRELGDNQWLSNIRYENERMGILVGQLLTLARTQSASMEPEKIDFSRLTAGETLPFESVAFEQNRILNSEISEGILIEGNSAQLKQLVSILLDNALEHGEDDGEIRLTLKKERQMAQLSVVNPSKPIPKEQMAQLFERFYRVDTVRNGKEGHYGLGLSIAKEVVQAHKGQIRVFCENGFVEFRVEIPML